jgi:hypothetical protein
MATGSERNAKKTVKMKITHKAVTCLMGTICCFFARSAAAYRPFFSTDAAVADTGKSEVELGTDEMNNRDGSTVAVPTLRYNILLTIRCGWQWKLTVN